MDHAVRQGGQLGVVGDEDEGRPVVGAHRQQQLQDTLAGVPVEVTGGLVREQEGGLGREGPGQCDSLLLTARELRWVVTLALGESHLLEEAIRARPCVRDSDQLEGNEHVLAGGQVLEELEGLEDEPDALASEEGQSVLVERTQIDAVQLDASLAGAIQTRQEPEEGRLAASRRTHDRDELPSGHLEVHVPEDDDLGFTRAQTLGEATAKDAGLAHGWDDAGVERRVGSEQRKTRAPGSARWGAGSYIRSPMRPTTLFFVLAFALQGCSDAPTEPEAPRGLPFDGAAEIEEADEPLPVLEIPADAPRVAFLGDSITAGLHLPAAQAFPAVLQRELADQGVPFHLIDGGVSGDTSAGGRRRIDWLLRSEPDVVVVELGANDGLRGIALQDTAEHLAALLGSVREHGSRPLLLGMRIPPSYGPEYTEGFARIYEDLAETEQVPLVPFFMEGVGGIPEMNLPDGMHPNPEGHRVLAERLVEPLREVLGSE